MPIFVIALVPIFAFAALAIDANSWRNDQRLQQTAADSAAIAGAAELAYPNGSAAPALYVTAAKTAAANNGFSDGGNATVTVNSPPASGPYATNPNAVEVLVTANHANFFAKAFGSAQQSITTRSVAVLDGDSGDCVYALHSSGTPILVNGSYLDALSCNVVTNGNWHLNGGTVGAANIGVVGTITTNAGSYPEAKPAATLPVGDPCQSFAACANLTDSPPDTSSCTYDNELVNGGTGSLQPGVYCGTTIFNGASVSLSPGLYVFTGQVIENGSSFSGTSVTIDNATSGAIFNGASTSLSAPTTGPYAGLLYYQPPSNTTTAIINGSQTGGCPIPSRSTFAGA